MMSRLDRSRVDAVAHEFFGASAFRAFQRVEKPAHAALAFVYVLDDRFILRGRPFDSATVASFEAEQRLLHRLRSGLVPWSIPRPLPTRDGGRFAVQDDIFWTLHEALPGRILCPWQTLHQLDSAALENLVTTMRRLHDLTRGRLSGGVPERFPAGVRRDLEHAGDPPSARARMRVELALHRIEQQARSFEAHQLAFVHGDFHYGNLLLDDDGRVTGLIDLDWCRVSHPLEDLAYTAMMLLRDYDRGVPRLELLQPIADWYGVEPYERDLFHEYLLLYTLYDVQVFRQAINLAQRDMYLEHQLDLLETLCARL